jgi:hypothetical protein
MAADLRSGRQLESDHKPFETHQRFSSLGKGSGALKKVVHLNWTEEAEVAKLQYPRRAHIHKNAPLTPKGRAALVPGMTENGLTKAAAALRYAAIVPTNPFTSKRRRASFVLRKAISSASPHGQGHPAVPP